MQLLRGVAARAYEQPYRPGMLPGVSIWPDCFVEARTSIYLETQGQRNSTYLRGNLHKLRDTYSFHAELPEDEGDDGDLVADLAQNGLHHCYLDFIVVQDRWDYDTNSYEIAEIAYPSVILTNVERNPGCVAWVEQDYCEVPSLADEVHNTVCNWYHMTNQFETMTIPDPWCYTEERDDDEEEAEEEDDDGAIRPPLEANDFVFRSVADTGRAHFILRRDGVLLGTVDGDHSFMTRLREHVDFYFAQNPDFEPVNDDAIVDSVEAESISAEIEDGPELSDDDDGGDDASQLQS